MYNEIAKFKFVDKLKKEINKEAYADVKHYQKIYKFKIGKGEHDTWNNESDAFKHTFSSAWLTFKYGNMGSKLIGDSHEREGRENKQDIAEEVMDLHNNRIGRNIAEQIKKDYPNWEQLSERELKDIVAQKVMDKMNNGELIKNPDESYSKKYKDVEKGYENVNDINKKIEKTHNNGKISTPIKDVNDDIKKKHDEKEVLNKKSENIDKFMKFLSTEDKALLQHFTTVFKLADKHINQQVKLKYTLPLVIKAVAKTNNLPVSVVTKFLIQANELYKNHFSNSASNSNGHWVTVNGNHVFIEDK